MPKLVVAAIAGLLAFVVANIVSSALFFHVGDAILFDPEMQSAKLIAVLFEIEPRPLMFENGLLYMAIVAVIGVLHGFVFMLIEPSLGHGRVRRGLLYAAVLWALMAVYFEFHAPFNMFREPVPLVALELLFWAVVAAVEGLVLSCVYGKSRLRPKVSPN